jgi:hypothetical protein
MEAGKNRLEGDTIRTATTSEVKDLRREARDLKEVVALQTLHHPRRLQPLYRLLEALHQHVG